MPALRAASARLDPSSTNAIATSATWALPSPAPATARRAAAWSRESSVVVSA